MVAVGLAVGRGEAPQSLAGPRDGVVDAAAARVGEGDAQVVAMAKECSDAASKRAINAGVGQSAVAAKVSHRAESPER